MTCRTCDLIRGLLMAQGVPAPAVELAVQAAAAAEPIVKKKARKKVSAYQKELGRQLEKLKKKHPRTAMKDLMSKAHAATKKEMKKR